jgi:hypothetical protein
MSHNDIQCESEHFLTFRTLLIMFILYMIILTKHYTVINPIL